MIVRTQKRIVWFVSLGLFLGVCPVGGQEDEFTRQRQVMVDRHLASRDITDPQVLRAMSIVPRHLFMSETYRHLAYADHPLPIGDGQTISQPYIVALMTQLLEVQPKEKILEIGTGSGYQAAVLAQLGAEVYTIEIIQELADRASGTLARLGYDSIHVKWGDGNLGWEQEAPFDAVIITCASSTIPPALFHQVREGGRIVLPLGNPQTYQTLCVIRKQKGKPVTQKVSSVRFVPMTSRKR
jgi:protein-L-isoaspartate(D-aspartate) O-methyltransferase